MANERTLLAYLRSSLMLLVTGGTILKLLAETLALLIAGWSIIVAGVLVALWGISRFRQFQQRFRLDEEKLEV